jgi:hypothetical protein
LLSFRVNKAEMVIQGQEASQDSPAAGACPVCQACQGARDTWASGVFPARKETKANLAPKDPLERSVSQEPQEPSARAVHPEREEGMEPQVQLVSVVLMVLVVHQAFQDQTDNQVHQDSLVQEDLRFVAEHV